jgi:hypothetical protein
VLLNSVLGAGVEIRGRRLHYGDCDRPGLPDDCAAGTSSGSSCIRRLLLALLPYLILRGPEIGSPLS